MRETITEISKNCSLSLHHLLGVTRLEELLYTLLSYVEVKWVQNVRPRRIYTEAVGALTNIGKFGNSHPPYSNMASSKILSHEEIWDDSMLIDSWNQALEEYKV